MRFGKVVIPARMESERLPNKMMIDVLGHPIIEHVWRRACLALPNQEVVVATDSKVIESHMKSIGAQVYFSKIPHSNGTSRVSEFVRESSLDFAVILQGDEILIRPELVKALFDKMSHGNSQFINVVSPLNDPNDLFDLDIVKCWIDEAGNIRFIFRSNPLRNPSVGYQFLRVINGLFAVSKDVLISIPESNNGLAASESIEQLGIIGRGNTAMAFEVNSYLPSVNTPKELEISKLILESDPEQSSIQKTIFRPN